MSQLSPSLVIYRSLVASDIPFIYSTWLKGLYYGNDWFREIDQKNYFEKYHKVIEAIMFKNEAQFKLACLKEDEEVVLGYSVYKANALHWVFVKSAWRKLGIAKELIPKDITECTHLTKIGKAIKPESWKFNPFL